MDVVVRTSHGDADIEIVGAPTATTLGDLLGTVTGQAPPPVARIDRRAVSTTQRLRELELSVGSVIDARPTEMALATPESPETIAVNLLQLTGRGAGSVSRLPVGRYRIGPGRRLNAGEMSLTPVDVPAFELVIDDRGDVTVAPGPRAGGPLGVLTPTLDGELLDRTLRWTGGRLSVGGRVYELENPAADPPTRVVGNPDDRGAISFHRPPTVAPLPDRLAVTARRRAAAAALGLWERRRDDPDAFSLPFGLPPTGEQPTTVDLLDHRGVAVVGTDRFRVGLARTLAVEASTIHGPADLRLVIASTPERLGQWDWAKWLPHVRGGDPLGHPELFDDDESLEEWAATARASAPTPIASAPAARLTGAPSGPASSLHPPPGVADASSTDAPGGEGDTVITMLVLDDVSLWNRRDSPIRALLVDPPAHIRIVALCGGMHEAPGACTALIEEQTPREVFEAAGTDSASGALFGSLATLHTRLGPSPETLGEIRPAIVESSTAREIALDLAALDDLEIDGSDEGTIHVTAPSLSDLIELQTAAPIDEGLPVTIGLARFGDDDESPTAPRPVRVDLASARVTLVSAADPETHDTMVAALILGATATRSTGRLSVLTAGATRPAWHAELPHLAGHVDLTGDDDPARLVHRVAHVLTSEPGLEVLVVVEDAFEPIAPTMGPTGEATLRPVDLLTGMLALADSLARVHVVMTTRLDVDGLSNELRAQCGVEILVDGHDDHPHGHVVGDHTDVAFVAPVRVADPGTTRVSTPSEPTQLLIRPSVHGRAMSPLERRISQMLPGTGAGLDHDPATRSLARRIGASAQHGAEPAHSDSLLPPPLTAQIDHLTLLDSHQGDGVPLGLLDRPERADTEAYRWRPGTSGSLIAIGSPRSGMTHLTDLLIVGIAARISADDLHVFAIEPLPQRRRALDSMPHAAGVVTTDEPAAARRVIATVDELLELRRGSPNPGEPDIVLIVGDLARLARWLPDDVRADAMETLARIGEHGHEHGINLVCLTTRVDDLGPVARLAGDRLVGEVSDPADRARLAVPAPSPSDRHPGRCWSVDADRRVQLATPPESVEKVVARLAPDAARSSPPSRRTGGADDAS